MCHIEHVDTEGTREEKEYENFLEFYFCVIISRKLLPCGYRKLCFSPIYAIIFLENHFCPIVNPAIDSSILFILPEF